MRKASFTTAIPVAVIALGLTLVGCSSTPAADTPSKAPMSQDGGSSDMPMAAAMKGSFEGLNGKMVAGMATIENGKLMLAGFSSDEGPDLHIYLTSGTDEAAVSAGRELDAVAFDKASQTFSLDGIDTSMYSYVVIHCDKAKAVFGAAKLS